MRIWAIALCLAACGGGGAANPDGGSNHPDAGPNLDPPTTCAVPAEGMPVDVSQPTTVVSDCSEAGLAAAVATGGIITFSCGGGPTTITLSHALVINNVAGADKLGDTVIDGGGTVTIAGGGSERLITLDACAPPFNDPHCDTFPHPHLTVQHLAFTGGHDTGTDGGGAIFKRGGSLTVIDSQFHDNACATSGQDTAGGAIRGEQATPVLIVGSSIQNNRCSDGGGLGFLQASPVTIINTVIDGNTATGTGGNPGNGGNAGGLYYDGVGLALSLCGVRITNNTGNAYGGGLFMVADNGVGTATFETTLIEHNTVPSHDPMPSFAGGAYIQGAAITMSNTTIDTNSADFAAGLFLNGMSGMGSFDATNLTVADHAGDAIMFNDLGGTILHGTIAGNTRGLVGGSHQMVIESILANTGKDCDVPALAATGTLETATACGGTAGNAMLGALGLAADDPTMIPTIAPGSGSPAIGAGHQCPTVDARGKARPTDGCTLGAHEVESTP